MWKNWAELMYLLPDKSSHDIFSFWLRPAAKSIEYQAKRKIVIESDLKVIGI